MCKVEKMEEYMEDKFPLVDAHLRETLADHHLMIFTSLGRMFCCRERYGEQLMMNLIVSYWKLQVLQAPCSPVDGICVIGVCMGRFCVGYPFGVNSLDEKKISSCIEQ